MSHFEIHALTKHSTINFFEYYGDDKFKFKTYEEAKKHLEDFILEANAELPKKEHFKTESFYFLKFN